ncbi:MAG: TonB-dependent receptor plug domain-containing protein [Oceanospirillaceae bacterium]|nr:TonB-dependent receptor plug domain-containing protein [Oceanospirillaceae bacterium]
MSAYIDTPLVSATVLMACTLITHAPLAHTSENDLFNMSLKQLMTIPVDVASNTMKPVREQPGTVTIITEQQIARSGARFLIDLIKQVPGFWVGTDTIGTMSVSFRGVWGMEAKILLIIDGIEQNELAFGSLVLGNRYPVSTIKQVEIIRGPGSVKFGSQAALAVIRVTSKGGDYQGQQVSVGADINKNGIFKNTYSLLSAGSIGVDSKIHYSSSISFAKGDYSDQTWRALDGYSIDLNNKSDSEPLTINTSIKSESSELRIIYDRFKQEDQLLFGDAGLFASPNQRYTQTNTLSFESINIRSEHNWRIDSNWSAQSKVTFVKQKPWNGDSQYNQILKRDAQRWRIDLLTQHHISKEHNIEIGAMYYSENEYVSESYLFDPDTRFDGKNAISQSDRALYLQYEANTHWANVTLGGRYENHDAAGSHFLPRVAITKSYNEIYGKLVYNQAFKIPQFDTLASAKNAGNPITKTELSTTSEIEVGYQINDQTNLSVNIFHLNIQNYIGFSPITASNETLGDFSAFGNELELNWITPDISLRASYSLFLIDKTNISAITVDNQTDAILGIPNHMLKLNTEYHLTKENSLNLNGAVISSRFACVEDNNLICGTPKKLNEEYDFNVFYRHSHANLHYNLGVANILDSSVKYVQPYRGSQSPIPGLSRRLLLDVQYDF